MLTTEKIHEAGVRRHRAAWARANQRAVDALHEPGQLKPWDPGVKEAVSIVVLRVLDGVQMDAGKKWDAGIGSWVPNSDNAK